MAVPPDFTAGQVLTAAQMNQIGLWLIKTQTIGSGVSSVAVTNAFSADYDNYLVQVSGGAGSTGTGISFRLGATATGYYWGYNQAPWTGAAGVAGQTNDTLFAGAGFMSATQISLQLNVYRPFATDDTWVVGQSVFLDTASGVVRHYGGFLNNTTSYTDFSIIPGTGTMTGGTIYVYGYRD